MALPVYVYCIVRADAPLRLEVAGLDERRPVRAIRHQGLAAVVSEVPCEDPDPSRANVLAHERVNEAVLRDRTVIPMAFGTVFQSSEDVLELLRSGHDTFDDVLGKLHGKIEFGLKVFSPPGQGALADAAAARQHADGFLERLRDVCVASRTSATIGDRMILNAAFLVERQRQGDFDQRVHEIAAEHEELTFQFTGPWPPYNFVAIRLKREAAA